MFARINHELKERDELEKARQELLKKKQSLIADNQKRKDDLASLDKDLETFIDVSQVLTEMCAGILTQLRLQNRYRRFSKWNIEDVWPLTQCMGQRLLARKGVWHCAIMSEIPT